MTSPAPSSGEDPLDPQSETTSAPQRDDAPPRRSQVQQSAWLVGIALVLVLFLGFMVGWGLGILD